MPAATFPSSRTGRAGTNSGESHFLYRIEAVPATVPASGNYRISQLELASRLCHLAALVAMSCGAEKLEPVASGQRGAAAPATLESDCVQAAVGWYGICDLKLERDRTTAANATPNANAGAAD